MSVRLRPALSSLPAYVPGRSVAGAVKLASNESAYGPVAAVIERISEAAAQAHRYPDTDSTELVDALAVRFGVVPNQVVVGCGSVSLCQQLVFATAGTGDEVLFGWRSFEAYPIISVIGAAQAVRVPLIEQRHDLKSMAAAVTDRTRLIFVCTPNNPTATTVTTAEMVDFLAQVPADVLVVLDEAYREFVTDPAAVDGRQLLARYPNLIVLRTFSKAYGLAGLRVGYAIAADPAVAAAVSATKSPFAVSTLAQVAALASLEPPAQLQMQQRVAEVISERARVTAGCRAVGYSIPDSQANFVWFSEGDPAAGGIDPLGFSAHCELRGVIVRAFAGSGVRVTIGSPAENDAFLAALPSLGTARS